MAWIARLRLAGLGVLAGLLAGLVTGIVARIDMRIVALSAGVPPTFTLGGSLNIALIGVILGAPFGVAFAYGRPYLPGLPQGWFVKGLAFGLLLFLVFVLPLYLWQPDFRSELALAPGLLGIGLFGTLPLFYGIVVGLITPQIDRRLPVDLQPRSATLVGYIALLIVGLAGFGLVIYGIVLAIMEAGR